MGNTEINIVPKFIDNALSAPAQSIGNSLSNFWELCIGNHVNLWVKKQEFKHQENLIEFKKINRR